MMSCQLQALRLQTRSVFEMLVLSTFCHSASVIAFSTMRSLLSILAAGATGQGPAFQSHQSAEVGVFHRVVRALLCVLSQLLI